jgi:hypothetical protein
MNEEIRAKLHAFRMEDFNNLYRENEEFKEYAIKVYEYCCRMKAGTCINLTRYSGQKLDWTLLTIAAFYCSGANHIEYYITDDYTRFARKVYDPVQLQKDIDAYLNFRNQEK